MMLTQEIDTSTSRRAVLLNITLGDTRRGAERVEVIVDAEGVVLLSRYAVGEDATVFVVRVAVGET